MRVDPELKRQPDCLSQATGRGHSVAAEAIREDVALSDWQIEENKKGVAEADRGDFASDKKVKRTIKK